MHHRYIHSQDARQEAAAPPVHPLVSHCFLTSPVSRVLLLNPSPHIGTTGDSLSTMVDDLDCVIDVLDWLKKVEFGSEEKKEGEESRPSIR